MRFTFMLAALAFGTSLDSLGVGIAFGLNGTRIRLKAHLIISAVMFAITAGSVALGNHVAAWMPEQYARGLSAVLFVGVGLGMLAPMARALRQGRFSFGDADCPCKSACAIRMREALGLGVALSINNVGGGVSAGLIHIGPMEMATLSVFFNVLCIVLGHQAASLLRRSPIKDWAQLAAAMMMVGIGIYELYAPSF